MESLTSASLIIGLFLVVGLLAGLFADRVGLPQVAGYVIAGMLFSPDMLGGLLGLELNDWSDTLTTAALGIIAYLIGGSMTMRQLRRMGKIILSSALCESLGAVLMVFLAMWWLAPEVAGVSGMQLSLVFAALAASTAPAATVAILHQYRTRGPMTTTLLGVVALDDALAILIFSTLMVFAVGQSLTLSVEMLMLEIGGAALLGIIMGRLLAWAGLLVQQRGLRLPLTLGFILFLVGLADVWHLSSLLAAMALGFSTRFFSRASGDKLFVPVESIENVVFIVFFTLAGAHFQVDVFSQYVSLIVIYFFARITGKIMGAAVGARFAGAPKNISRWLGLGLMPQAGVAIGLSLILGQYEAFYEISIIVVNVILATTLFNELLGLIATRYALQRAGELGEKRKRSLT